MVLSRKTGVKARTGRVTTRLADPGLCMRGRNLEIKETSRLGDVEGPEDLGLTGSGVRSLSHSSLSSLHGDQMHAVEFVSHVAPGVVSSVLKDPHEQQPQPAELDVDANAVLAVMKDRSKSE